MEQLLLGIDIGTTAAKAVLFTPDGRLEAVASADYSLHHLRPAWVEQEPEDWWRAACLAIRQALKKVPHGATRVAGIAVSAQAPTMLPLDASGKPLRRALIWMDRRAEAEVSEMVERLDFDRIYRVTGNRPDAFYVAPRLLWYKKHEPELLAQTHQFVQINGYINLRLTGEYSLDPVHATLLQLRHYASGEWYSDLCDLCGVTPDHFPPVMPGHHILGGVTNDAAEATGLRPGTPVMVGTVDGSAAALEAGVVAPGLAAEMTGTSTVLLLPNETGITEPAFIAMPHAIPGMHLLLGAMVASGASLRWFRDTFAETEVETAKQQNLDAFDLLTEQAAQIKPGSDGVIFLPYMMGERAPIWHTQARGVFFGLTLASSKGAIVRAILEGTAFALHHNLQVARNAGVPVQEIRSVGGGTRSALWNQIKADVTGFPVLLPETSVGAPFGDALLAGMGLNLYTDMHETAAKLIRIQTVYEPDRESHERYHAVYAVYRRIYEHLREDFDAAAAVFQEL